MDVFSQDDNRYNASKGAHINLKRAERARATIAKLPSKLKSPLLFKSQCMVDRRM